jgi:hypothetical protein
LTGASGGHCEGGARLFFYSTRAAKQADFYVLFYVLLLTFSKYLCACNQAVKIKY